MAGTIKFLKIRDVKSPSRAHQFDAGIDFYIPEFNAEFIADLKEKNPHVYDKHDSDSKIMMCNVDTLTMMGTDSNVRYDLSDDNDSTIKFDDETGKNYFLLSPHSRIMIPSGIRSRMESPDRALIAANKSGVATKHGLVFGAQVVDYLYKGEIHISLINTSTNNVRIYAGMKVIQFLETPIFNNKIEIIDGTDDGVNKNPNRTIFYSGLQDDRGESGFGSTDKK